MDIRITQYGFGKYRITALDVPGEDQPKWLVTDASQRYVLNHDGWEAMRPKDIPWLEDHAFSTLNFSIAMLLEQEHDRCQSG